MTIDCTSVPKHLKMMRAITGTEEYSGSGDNPRIMGMRDWIACTYPEMAPYCEGYTGDDVAWCGLTQAFCCCVAGIRPPFGPTDTDRFLWAQSFGTDDGFEHQVEPCLGSIVVMKREGGGHVCTFEGWANSGHTSFYGRGGNQSDEVNVTTQSVDNVIAWVWPRGLPKPAPGPGPDPGPDPDDHPELEEGDSGAAVVSVQNTLGIPADGDFGGQTDAAVKGFQDSIGLVSDGVVGPITWEQLDFLDEKMAKGTDGLDDDVQEEIVEMARNSAIQSYSWDDRGRSPPGYIPGMALAFALAILDLEAGRSWTKVMSQAIGDDDTDALAWLAGEFRSAGLDSSPDPGIDMLRNVFVLMIGLGMRESSGNHWEGRDMSASNVQPDTCEAGLFQTSWDISPASKAIPELLDVYWIDPNGFRETFSEGLSPDESDLDNYGSGDIGTKYQWLAKFCPAFHIYVTGVGLRTRRQHWGPVNRNEVEILEEVDEMLQDVQRIMAA